MFYVILIQIIAKRVDLLEKENEELRDLLEKTTCVQREVPKSVSGPIIDKSYEVSQRRKDDDDIPGVSEWVKDRLKTMK